jgi:thiol:disulfide interchange protein DsbD
VGSVCIIFGLVTLEIFSLPLPRFLIKSDTKQGNFWSVFILGLVSGLIIGPCTAPVLGAILVYVASRENILYGSSLLFTYAYAQGLVLILAGTFSGFLAALPKSGKWMLVIQRICGILLIVAGGLFLLQAWRLWR